MSPQAAPQLVVASTPESMAFRRLIALLAGVTLPVVVLDQLSKYFIRTNFEMFRTSPVIPGWLDLTYTENPGAAFSLFATMPEGFRHAFFVILSIGAIIVLSWLIARPTTTLTVAIGFALVLGGTVGNLIDRLARGRVVDFIYFHHGWFSYPVFNIADSAITIGVVMILILTVFAGSSGPPPHG